MWLQNQIAKVPIGTAGRRKHSLPPLPRLDVARPTSCRCCFGCLTTARFSLVSTHQQHCWFGSNHLATERIVAMMPIVSHMRKPVEVLSRVRFASCGTRWGVSVAWSLKTLRLLFIPNCKSVASHWRLPSMRSQPRVNSSFSLTKFENLTTPPSASCCRVGNNYSTKGANDFASSCPPWTGSRSGMLASIRRAATQDLTERFIGCRCLR
mmetsp:Transcript_7108/g.17388  ORF Transcript_7108/g.17388 Transcript_7108/m.17388 type:complete len:209 (-) Transcript_7108:1187-1813(-)